MGVLTSLDIRFMLIDLNGIMATSEQSSFAWHGARRVKDALLKAALTDIEVEATGPRPIGEIVASIVERATNDKETVS